MEAANLGVDEVRRRRCSHAVTGSQVRSWGPQSGWSDACPGSGQGGAGVSALVETEVGSPGWDCTQCCQVTGLRNGRPAASAPPLTWFSICRASLPSRVRM